MSNCFIILAAGQSKRFKFKKPKQYVFYKNKPLYKHSIDKILKSNLFKRCARKVVPRGGIEPPTRGFSVLCSTD